MDDWHTGRLLVATPALEDPNFARTVIFVLDHDEDGALGVVLNRASEVAVDETLPPWVDLAAHPPVLFGGGPVEPTAVVALGRATAAVMTETAVTGSWTPILDRIQLVDLERDPVLAAAEYDRIRLFAGYAGWAPDQLEDEIDQGAWFVVDAEPDDVFTARPAQLWHDVLRRQPSELALLATFPVDPSLN